MFELIKVTETKDDRQVVSAKELYEALELSSAHWNKWSKTNIEENEFFLEGIAWEVFTPRVKTPNGAGGRPSKDYYITIDFAKHLAMMSKSAKAHEVRNYFIDCEKFIKNKCLEQEFLLFRQGTKIERNEWRLGMTQIFGGETEYWCWQYSDLINMKVLGMTSKQYKESKGLGSQDLIRDNMEYNQLGRIVEMEQVVLLLCKNFQLAGIGFEEMFEKIKGVL